MLVHPSAHFIGEIRRNSYQIKGHLPYAHSRGAGAEGDLLTPLPSTDLVAADMVRTSPVALPVAVSKSFQALPWRPLVSSPNEQPALCASRSCLDWNNLKCSLIITEAVKAGAAPPGGRWTCTSLLQPAISIMIVMHTVYLWGFQKYRDFSRHS